MRIIIFPLLSLLFHLIALSIGSRGKLEEDEYKNKPYIKVKLKKNIKQKKTKSFKEFNQLLSQSYNQSLGAEKIIDLSNQGTKKVYLYDFIEEGLTYPSDYIKYGIQGVVKAKLYFNKEGQFQIKSSIFNSKNGFLRFHIMSYLKKKLKSYTLPLNQRGLIEMKFIFRFTASHLRKKNLINRDLFHFEREAFRTQTKAANVLLETGYTLLSLLNLLKFRPDFLKSNKELYQEKLPLMRLRRIMEHPYYR